MRRLFFQLVTVLTVLIYSISWAQIASQKAIVASDTDKPFTIPVRVNQLSDNLYTLNQQVQKRAAPTDEMIQRLLINLKQIQKQIDELKNQANEKTLKVQITNVDEASLQLQEARKKTQKMLANIADNQKTIKVINESYQSINQLASNPINQSAIEIEHKTKILAFQKDISVLQQKLATQMAQWQNTQARLAKAEAQLKHWHLALSNRIALLQPSEIQKPISINKQQAKTEATLEQLSKALEVAKSQGDLSVISSTQQQIYVKQTQLWLFGIDQKLLSLLQTLPSLSSVSLETLSIEQLQAQERQTNKAINTLRLLDKQINQRYSDWRVHTDIIGESQNIEAEFKQRLNAIAYQQLLLHENPEILAETINRKKQSELFSIDTLYRDNLIIDGVKKLPNSLVQIGYQIQISLTALFQKVEQYPLRIVVFSLLIFLLAWGVLKVISHVVTSLWKSMRKEVPINISLAYQLLYSLKCYRRGLLSIIFFIIFVSVTDTPHPSTQILLILVCTALNVFIWFKLINVEGDTNKHLHPKARFRRITGVILAVFASLYALAYMSAITSPTLSLLEKLLIMTLATFTWSEKERFITLLARHQQSSKRQTDRLYVLALSVLPWIVIIVCLMSLVGYSRLTWLILNYLSISIVYWTCLIAGVNLINFMRKRVKVYCLKKYQHGAFIASEIVSPLSKVSKVAWVWVLTNGLFITLGWTRNSYLMVKLRDIFQTQLITLGSTAITLEIIAFFVLAIYIILAVARWLKTFSYHLLYSRIDDVSIRNSLSIFSQYVIAVVGVLLALNVMGIDLTTLAVFAGALGVGIGLGLQDIAKNFISGIVLLIERPLRDGDWIDIDGKEGTVKSIGMRAITLETFDKQEVIIPNGNAINNSFTNNTHADSVLRTLLYVGAGYRHNPETVIQLLEDILQNNQAILSDPAHMVVLWEYADSAINYRIQYHINLQVSNIHKVRTDVLKSIWQTFNEHNIEIPFPQRDIIFRQAQVPAAKKEDDNE